MAFEDEQWDTIDWKPIDWKRCIERGALVDISGAACEQGVEVTLAITELVWRRCLEVREIDDVEHWDTEAAEHEELRVRTLIDLLKPNLARYRKKRFFIVAKFSFPETCECYQWRLKCSFGRDIEGRRVAVVTYLSYVTRLPWVSDAGGV